MQGKDLCPLCGEGHLALQSGSQLVDYKGQSSAIVSYFSVCDHCGSEQADAGQVRANKRAVVAFKKQVDGFLTGAEVKAVREQLGITQAQAAKVFGGGPVAFAKYEADDVTQSEAMDKLIRLAASSVDAFHILAERIGLVPKADVPAWHSNTVEQHLAKVCVGAEVKPLMPKLQLVVNESWR
ncbi:type II toxin-antitoxin system MqsA family antitoxin [Rheinheimera marina]|uniref:Type II toxin-antitoxin system MqsA family antitoxin n=1 Tax=Rheinheimera marina TaxID=1774958 RepID=A0ABV9JKK1_9GAMM